MAREVTSGQSADLADQNQSQIIRTILQSLLERLAAAAVEVVAVVVVAVQGQVRGTKVHSVFRGASDGLHSSTLAHAPHRAMNQPPAVLRHADDDTVHSPKRKKVRRQKYAPKACMSRRPRLRGAFRWFRSSSSALPLSSSRYR